MVRTTRTSKAIFLKICCCCQEQFLLLLRTILFFFLLYSFFLLRHNNVYAEFCVLPMYNSVTHCSTNDTEAPNKIDFPYISYQHLSHLIVGLCHSNVAPNTICFFFIIFLKAYVQEEDCITFYYYFQLYVISFAAKNP